MFKKLKMLKLNLKFLIGNRNFEIILLLNVKINKSYLNIKKISSNIKQSNKRL